MSPLRVIILRAFIFEKEKTATYSLLAVDNSQHCHIWNKPDETMLCEQKHGLPLWQAVPHKGSFTPNNSVTIAVTNVTLTGKMCMQPILPITVPSKSSKVLPINITVMVMESFGEYMGTSQGELLLLI